MVIFYVFSAIAFTVIILIIWGRVTLGFSFIMESLACNVSVTVYFFGDKFKKDIAVYPARKKENKKKKKSYGKKIDFKIFKKSFPDILKALKILKKGVTIKEIEVYLKEGTGDAFNTAFLYGLLWNLSGLLETAVCSNFIVKNKKIIIEADFKEKMWKLNIGCIFRIRIVNIILMCKQLLIFYLKNRKGGDGDVRASNRRFNDYSNAKY
ncbi:hypothetical protein LY28_01958 [Ruminiclostridium sufflavum DSM 19573]|uniref:DUF2953 family protein n=1 Tax=Ruminiclostridium sufflavum DSM 19573 TaxID=1121337 RepID=A0A318XPI5_9FIRM|nr:DUF2953 domain-containing protein [Ruminiclostridium sufflavum]PYG87589.1 hypothetical protein LY28_01958 [Ruminiclostridium sufflavum DSM 19573]